MSSQIVSELENAVEYRDFGLFERFSRKLSQDYNAFVVDDPVHETQLNVLHLLSGFESTDFILKLIHKWLALGDVNIDSRGTLEGNYGITAAHIAVLNHNTETLQLLIDSRCDIFLCDSNGKNIQDYAKLEDDSSSEILEIIDDAIKDFFQTSRFASKPFLVDTIILPCIEERRNCSAISPIHSENEDEIPKKENETVKNFVDLGPEVMHNFEDDFEEEVPKLNEELNKNSIDEDCISVLKLDIPPLSDIEKRKNIHEQQTEIYIHKDKHIEFLEKRTPGTNYLIEEQLRLSGSEAGSQGSTETGANTSIETVMDDFILKMTNSQLKDHFRQSFGQNPGPINDLTRKLYQKKANRALKSEKRSPFEGTPKSGKVYRKNAYDVLMRNYRLNYDDLFQRKFNFQEAIRLEEILVKEFSPDTASLFSENGIAPSNPEVTFFVYLLLDPEITKNLPERANLSFESMLFGGNGSPLLNSLDPSLFVSFVKAIFYAGKGKNNRPYKHFYDALTVYAARSSKNVPRMPTSRDPRATESRKVEKILDIWSKRRGPISLHCFHGISADEAFAREYLIIETLGLQNLTNRISGNSRIKNKLNAPQRQILGTYLLYKAFIILLLNGERQIKRTNKLRL